MRMANAKNVCLLFLRQGPENWRLSEKLKMGRFENQKISEVRTFV